MMKADGIPWATCRGKTLGTCRLSGMAVHGLRGAQAGGACDCEEVRPVLCKAVGIGVHGMCCERSPPRAPLRLPCEVIPPPLRLDDEQQLERKTLLMATKPSIKLDSIEHRVGA